MAWASGRDSVGSTSVAVCSATNSSMISRLSSSVGMNDPSTASRTSRGVSAAAGRAWMRATARSDTRRWVASISSSLDPK